MSLARRQPETKGWQAKHKSIKLSVISQLVRHIAPTGAKGSHKRSLFYSVLAGLLTELQLRLYCYSSPLIVLRQDVSRPPLLHKPSGSPERFLINTCPILLVDVASFLNTCPIHNPAPLNGITFMSSWSFSCRRFFIKIARWQNMLSSLQKVICGRWITCQGSAWKFCSTRIHRVVMTLRSSYRPFLQFLYTISRRYKSALASIRCCYLLLWARYR